jgi:hypothetical protein
MKKFIIFLILLFFNVSFIYSMSINVSIEENAEVTKLLSGQFAIDARGSIEIKNPSLIDTIYEMSFPLNLDSLIGINKVHIDNSSLDFDFSFNRINTFLILPNETVRVGYRIYGLTNANLFTVIDSENISVLEYYVDDFEFYSNPILNLQKLERDGFNYNQSGQLVSAISGNSSRVVGAGIKNPSSFDLNIKFVNLYRTDTANPFLSEGVIIDREENKSISPYSSMDFNFIDLNSRNNSVYWLSTKTTIKNNIVDSLTRSYSIQQNSGGGGSGGGGSGGGGSGGGSSFDFNNTDEEITIDIKESVFIKKDVNKTIVRSGDEFKVILSIVNVNDFEIINSIINDEIPSGYEIKDVSNSVKINNQLLEFVIENIGPYETQIIEYTLLNKEENQNRGITYLKPAILTLEDGSEIFSEGVIIINELLPEKKLFVQKETKPIENDFVKVTIKVKNLGSYALENILISDNLDNNALIKDISQVFHEKGIWKINKLDVGDVWEVSYITEDLSSSLETLPNVYGVEDSEVYETLIVSEEIINRYEVGNGLIEKIGLGIAVFLLLLYLLF